MCWRAVSWRACLCARSQVVFAVVVIVDVRQDVVVVVVIVAIFAIVFDVANGTFVFHTFVVVVPRAHFTRKLLPAGLHRLPILSQQSELLWVLRRRMPNAVNSNYVLEYGLRVQHLIFHEKLYCCANQKRAMPPD